MKKYISMVLIVCMVFAFLTVAYAATPVCGYAWDKTSLKCYINPNITYNYGSSISTAIGNGITSWNSTDAPSISLSDDYIDWDVIVEMGDLGETGWDGYCVTYFVETDNGNTTDHAIINLNTGHIGSYATDAGLWKALACHEMGHAHGLDHNTTSNENSIMKTYTKSYYNYSGTSLRWTVPQTADRTAVNSIY